MQLPPTRFGYAALVLSASLLGCEEPKKAPAPKPSAPAAAAPTPTATASAKPKKVRPLRNAKLDVKLTDERRKKIEGAIPDAKGFVLASDLEKQVHKMKLDDEAKALKAFDAKAKGKWILFTGNMNNMTADGFDMAVSYTPKAEGDPFGMSRKWFYVKFAKVEGFDADLFKKGEMGIVVAKYNGNKEASPAHEVLELGHW